MEIKRIDNGVFEVTGTRGIYTVELNPLSCTCPQTKYRNVRSGELCKHLKEVIRSIENGLL